MASESTSNLGEEAVCNPFLPSSQCQQCKAVYNTKLLRAPLCRKCYVVPENTTPLIIWAQRFHITSDRKDGDYSSWQRGKRFEAAINKHIGNDCSGRGTTFFLKGDDEFVADGDVISLMIDIPQGLADTFRENPDKVQAFFTRASEAIPH